MASLATHVMGATRDHAAAHGNHRSVHLPLQLVAGTGGMTVLMQMMSDDGLYGFPILHRFATQLHFRGLQMVGAVSQQDMAFLARQQTDWVDREKFGLELTQLKDELTQFVKFVTSWLCRSPGTTFFAAERVIEASVSQIHEFMQHVPNEPMQIWVDELSKIRAAVAAFQEENSEAPLPFHGVPSMQPTAGTETRKNDGDDWIIPDD